MECKHIKTPLVEIVNGKRVCSPSVAQKRVVSISSRSGFAAEMTDLEVSV